MGEEKQQPDTISEEEFGRWLTPKQAIASIGESTGDWNGAPRSILRRAASGKIEVRAEDIEWKCGSRSGKFAKFCPVPVELLKRWHEYDNPSRLTFWNSGDVEFESEQGIATLSSLPVDWEIYGVRFDPAGITKLAAAARNGPPQAAATPSTVILPAPHAGGAPSKDFWPDLWIAIASQLYNGDLQPTKQADIEKAMLAWASDNDRDLSEATTRRHAPKLWNLLKKEGS